MHDDWSLIPNRRNIFQSLQNEFDENQHIPNNISISRSDRNDKEKSLPSNYWIRPPQIKSHKSVGMNNDNDDNNLIPMTTVLKEVPEGTPEYQSSNVDAKDQLYMDVIIDQFYSQEFFPAPTATFQTNNSSSKEQEIRITSEQPMQEELLLFGSFGNENIPTIKHSELLAGSDMLNPLTNRLGEEEMEIDQNNELDEIFSNNFEESFHSLLSPAYRLQRQQQQQSAAVSETEGGLLSQDKIIEAIDDILFVSHIEPSFSPPAPAQLEEKSKFSTTTPAAVTTSSDLSTPMILSSPINLANSHQISFISSTIEQPSGINQINTDERKIVSPHKIIYPPLLTLSKPQLESFISKKVKPILDQCTGHLAIPMENYTSNAASNFLNLKRKVLFNSTTNSNGIVNKNKKPPDKKNKSDEYEITSKVGKGAFGQAVLATNTKRTPTATGKNKNNNNTNINQRKYIFKIDKDKYSVQWEVYIHSLVRFISLNSQADISSI
jgi:hypothetical protein